MKSAIFSIAEGKKRFSEIIKIAEKSGEGVIISRRGSPVAVILPYSKYAEARKKEAISMIAALRKEYRRHNVSAEKIYKASRTELEARRGKTGN